MSAKAIPRFCSACGTPLKGPSAPKCGTQVMTLASKPEVVVRGLGHAPTPDVIPRLPPTPDAPDVALPEVSTRASVTTLRWLQAVIISLAVWGTIGERGLRESEASTVLLFNYLCTFAIALFLCWWLSKGSKASRITVVVLCSLLAGFDFLQLPGSAIDACLQITAIILAALSLRRGSSASASL